MTKNHAKSPKITGPSASGGNLAAKNYDVLREMPTESTPTFGDLLHSHRVRASLTQDALAERAGVSERAVSDLERGLRQAPHGDTILRLANALSLGAGDRALLQAVAQRPRRTARREAQPVTVTPKSPVFRPPALPTRTIGRERELAEICGALSGGETRLLTLTGPGGSGKTRLSIAAATVLAKEFEWGAAFVSLASLADPELVLGAIVEAVAVHESPGTALRDSVKAFLREKSILLVLDNFEQVTEAAPLVAELLDACPALKVLVTSRAALRLRAEREHPVVPLPVPNGPRFPPLERLARVPAVQLFVERAQAVRPNFSLTTENAAAVAELCIRLEGLPLALELAAARSRVLTPQAMLERLDNRLRLLVGGPRDLPARHQTMRAAITWSYELLTTPEQTLFRRFAVFSAGCTLDACEAVCDGDHELGVDVLEGLDALVGHSLVKQEEQPDGELRFRMLETIRDLARERLEASGEAETIGRLHATFCRSLAEATAPLLKGAERKATLQRLRDERDNLRQALAWAVARGEASLAMRLVAALDWWYRSEAPTEGQRWGEAALGLAGAATPSAERAAALAFLGGMLRVQGHQPVARRYLEESVVIWRGLGDRLGLAHALALLGWSLTAHPAEASAALEECVALFREVGTPWDLAFALLTQGMVHIAGENVPAARAVLDECIALEPIHGDAWLAAQSLLYLGRLEAHAGALDAAASRYEASLAMFEQIADKFYIMVVLSSLAVTSLLQGDLERTAQLCAEGVMLSRREGLSIGLAANITGLAIVIFHRGPAALAARLFSAGDALREQLDYPVTSQKATYQQHIDAMRAALGNSAFEAAWMEGRALPIEDAIAEALAAIRDLGTGAPVLRVNTA